jgi:hypothetical protein
MPTNGRCLWSQSMFLSSWQCILVTCSHGLTLMGTSSVKYKTPLPCIGLSESDTKLYYKFEFCEGCLWSQSKFLSSWQCILVTCSHGLTLMGTSSVKYKTPLPCISLSESDTKIYYKFEFCEGKHHKHLRNTLIYKAKQFKLPNVFFSRKVYKF